MADVAVSAALAVFGAAFFTARGTEVLVEALADVVPAATGFDAGVAPTDGFRVDAPGEALRADGRLDFAEVRACFATGFDGAGPLVAAFFAGVPAADVFFFAVCPALGLRAAGCFVAGFRATDFFEALFLPAVFFAVVFAAVLRAAGFFAPTFVRAFATDFFAAALAGAFAVDFFAVDLATDFLPAATLRAAGFFFVVAPVAPPDFFLVVDLAPDLRVLAMIGLRGCDPISHP